jgi:hypothetical protein
LEEALAMRRGSHSEREVFWRVHLSQQQGLGVSARVYCRVNGLSVRSFYRWQRRLGRAVDDAQVDRSDNGCALSVPTVLPPPAVKFAEVHVVDDGSHAVDIADGPRVAGIEIVLRGGRRIRVGRGFDEATFVRVVALLEGGRSC